LYQACGKPREGFSASTAAIVICQELELPFDVWPLPKWVKALIRFANRGKFYLAVCFLSGVVAFPFAVIWIIVLTLWRFAFGRFHR